MVEVFFKEGGVVLTSLSHGKDSFVSTARKSLVDDYLDDKDGPPRTDYSNINLPAFEEYIAQIKAEVEVGVATLGTSIVFTETRHGMRAMLKTPLSNFLQSRDKS